MTYEVKPSQGPGAAITQKLQLRRDFRNAGFSSQAADLQRKGFRGNIPVRFVRPLHPHGCATLADRSSSPDASPCQSTRLQPQATPWQARLLVTQSGASQLVSVSAKAVWARFTGPRTRDLSVLSRLSGCRPIFVLIPFIAAGFKKKRSGRLALQTHMLPRSMT